MQVKEKIALSCDTKKELRKDDHVGLSYNDVTRDPSLHGCTCDGFLKRQTVKQNISPYLFDDHLLLSLDSKWNTVFNGKLTFQVFIRQGKLHIVSNQCLK